MKSISEQLLSVKELAIEYSDGYKTPKVSFDLAAGESVALMGRSGIGKTSIALSLMGLLSESAQCSGEIWLNKTGLHLPQFRDWRKVRGTQMAMVPQDPVGWLNPTMIIGAQLSEAIRADGNVSRKLARQKVEQLFANVGLETSKRFIHSFPHQLSGGMCQRVAIAIAIARGPQLLIADEPTSSLDEDTQQGVLDLLERLRQKSNMSLLLITHDHHLADKATDRTIVMSKAEVDTRQSRVSSIQIDVHPQPASRMADDQMTDDSLSNGSRVLQPQPFKPRVLVQAVGLVKRFGDLTVVDNVNISINKGETFALIGKSGSGKTTIGRLLLSLIQPTEGNVYFDGTDLGKISHKKMRSLRSRMQIVQQNPYGSLDPRLSIEAIVSEPLFVHKYLGSIEQRVKAMMTAVHLDASLLARRPSQLSGGQRQRVAIARALIIEPEFVVLDEPVTALDEILRDDVLKLLRNLRTEMNLTYLLISHDMPTVDFLQPNSTLYLHDTASHETRSSAADGAPK